MGWVSLVAGFYGGAVGVRAQKVEARLESMALVHEVKMEVFIL